MANVFSIGIGRMVANDGPRLVPKKRQRASARNRHDDLLYESHDLAATQVEHALRLGRLYLASARMSCGQPDTAERDIARAECLFHWAREAVHKAPTAGRCLLNRELALLEAELDSFGLGDRRRAQSDPC